MPKKIAKKLSNLQMEEISGVDHPAHLAEGWLVMKSSSGNTELPDEILEVLEEVTKGEDMPDDEKDGLTLDQAKSKIAELEAKLAESTHPDTDPDESDEGTRAAQEEASKNELEAAKAKIAELEATIEGANTGEDVEKALILKSLPPHVREFVMEIDAKAESALEELQKARDDAADREYIEKARGWQNLTINPASIGPALRVLADSNPGLSKEIERALSSANEVAKSAGVTKEVGGWASIDDETPIARLNSLANDLVQKSTAPITFSDAFDQVISTPAGKKLYDEYREEKKRSAAMGGY